MDIVARLQKLMDARGIVSQNQLSVKSGIPQSTLSTSFNDVHKPSVATIELICNYFGLTLAEFFSDPETDTFYPLTEKERKLIAYWNGLSEEQRDALLGFLEAMK